MYIQHYIELKKAQSISAKMKTRQDKGFSFLLLSVVLGILAEQ